MDKVIKLLKKFKVAAIISFICITIFSIMQTFSGIGDVLSQITGAPGVICGSNSNKTEAVSAQGSKINAANFQHLIDLIFDTEDEYGMKLTEKQVKGMLGVMTNEAGGDFATYENDFRDSNSDKNFKISQPNSWWRDWVINNVVHDGLGIIQFTNSNPNKPNEGWATKLLDIADSKGVKWSTPEAQIPALFQYIQGRYNPVFWDNNQSQENITMGFTKMVGPTLFEDTGQNGNFTPVPKHAHEIELRVNDSLNSFNGLNFSRAASDPVFNKDKKPSTGTTVTIGSDSNSTTMCSNFDGSIGRGADIKDYYNWLTGGQYNEQQPDKSTVNNSENSFNSTTDDGSPGVKMTSGVTNAQCVEIGNTWFAWFEDHRKDKGDVQKKELEGVYNFDWHRLKSGKDEGLLGPNSLHSNGVGVPHFPKYDTAQKDSGWKLELNGDRRKEDIVPGTIGASNEVGNGGHVWVYVSKVQSDGTVYVLEQNAPSPAIHKHSIDKYFGASEGALLIPPDVSQNS